MAQSALINIFSLVADRVSILLPVRGVAAVHLPHHHVPVHGAHVQDARRLHVGRTVLRRGGGLRSR